ncbi:MAG: heterodisulfide reductase-related iron-sulfur binding cluster [Bacillota bacterium]
MEANALAASQAIAEFIKALGKEKVLTDREDLLCYSYDATPDVPGALPEAVVMPENTAEVVQVMKIASEYRVTVCPTCGEAFLHYYPALLTGETREKARALVKKTMDITDFLVKYNLGVPEVWGPVPDKITYHSPCHLDRGMGVFKQPLELIKQVPGAVLLPLREPAACCGGAGAFSFTNRELSAMVLNPKVADIRQTGAQTVLTGCSACRMQLAEGLARAGLAAEVLHTVEFLARARKEKPS